MVQISYNYLVQMVFVLNVKFFFFASSIIGYMLHSIHIQLLYVYDKFISLLVYSLFSHIVKLDFYNWLFSSIVSK